MGPLLLILLGASVISGDWVQVQPILPADVPKKGERGDEEDATTSNNNACVQNIHSWTEQTWATHKNDSSQDENIDNAIPKSSEGKLMVLRATEDRLTEQIYGEITKIGVREARGMKGGMGSTEGALITISLLTFAVYLIKLVKMLVHELHEKKGNKSATQASQTATSLPNVQTFVLHHGRRKRTTDFSLFSAMNDVNF